MERYGWRSNYGHIWIECRSPDRIPDSAVHAGRDTDREPIYVGRAWHEGDLLPAKIVSHHKNAYVCYGGQEIPKSEFEVMCGPPVAWQDASNGSIPPHAIPMGQTSSNEPLYMGRALHEGAMTPGKVQPSHGVLYIPYGGQEIAKKEYEVMVYPPQ